MFLYARVRTHAISLQRYCFFLTYANKKRSDANKNHSDANKNHSGVLFLHVSLCRLSPSVPCALSLPFLMPSLFRLLCRLRAGVFFFSPTSDVGSLPFLVPAFFRSLCRLRAGVHRSCALFFSGIHWYVIGILLGDYWVIIGLLLGYYWVIIGLLKGDSANHRLTTG